ncbi:hypothetical protein Vi05172_g10985 [Venturia inaequalis]|nr:hypothetical protein Vi05172_g10985 [Venturia inaequalis]
MDAWTEAAEDLFALILTKNAPRYSSLLIATLG